MTTVEWMPIDKLFARLSGLDDHAKQVIKHWLGPELQKRHLEGIVADLKEGGLSHDQLAWFIGCDVMRVFSKDDSIAFGWRRVKDERVNRVTELLLSATYIPE